MDRTGLTAACGRSPILLVEDDLDLRTLLAAHLERRGHEVITSGNGREALAYLQRGQRPRLIVTDLDMPCMDGYELREHFARSEVFANVPLVVMTSQLSPDRSRLGEVPVLPKADVRRLLAIASAVSPCARPAGAACGRGTVCLTRRERSAQDGTAARVFTKTI